MEPRSPPILDAASFRAVAELVFEHTGIRLAPGKEYFVVSRLGKLLRDTGCSRWEDLPDAILRAGTRAREGLVQAVLTLETSFFRDGRPFQALHEVLVPELARGGPVPYPLRIWSAGCSTGQEPYSIVMCLADLLDRGRIRLDLLATDLSPVALERARQGVYDPWELERGLDEGHRARYFEPLDRGRARIRADVRRWVRFRRHNLVAGPPPETGFDVVFCRNVGIYFGPETLERLHRNLTAALRPGGVLVLGAGETVSPELTGFRPEYPCRTLVYRYTAEDLP
ncbi:CheR family methyltransferase [Deferrisoma camini]|uniref:CheR family methyltransferase n=1 Tax=Deferrisoma camini TaxID=1035120 RepID=UPI0004B580E0|nr:protein-glutamate O-methyltransferase CheR [Deferrisoma camini]